MVLKLILLILPLRNKSEAYNVSDSYTHLNPANHIRHRFAKLSKLLSLYGFH